MQVLCCKQCGEIKPLEQFRQYYGGRKGHYKTCKQCEKINTRRKYLSRKELLSDKESEELSKIYELYEVQRASGLRPPNATQAVRIDNLDRMIEKYRNGNELQEWLRIDISELTEPPEHYLDHVYEQLSLKYMPAVSIDKKTMLPIFDETYKKELGMILDKFYAYEETYYGRN